MPSLRMAVRLCVFMAAVAGPATADDPKPPAVTFEKDVRPVLKKHCLGCHNAERPRGELDLSTFAALSVGGVSGPAAVAGKPDASPLYTLAAHLDEPKMPPGKPKIPQRDLDVLKGWIAGGLVEKAGATAATAQVPPPAPKTTAGGLVPAVPFPRPTAVTALAVSPAAPLAAVAGHKQVLVYDLAANKLLGGLAFPEGEVHALRFSRDGSVLIAGGGVGGQSGQVVGFDTKTWVRLWAVGDEADAVLAADLSPDKTTVVLGGPGRVVKVVAVPDGKVRHTFRKPTDWVLSAAFSPDGLLVAAGDRFGGLTVWETKSGKEFATLRGHVKGVTALGWRADGDVLASAGEDGTVRLWDLHTGTESKKWEAHPGGVLALDWPPNGLLATGGRDRAAALWTAAGERVTAHPWTPDEVLRVGLVPDGKSLVAGDAAGRVKLLRAGGSPAADLPLPVAKPAPVAVVPVPAPAARVAAVVPPVGRAAVNVAEELAEARKALAAAAAALKAAEDRLNKLEAEINKTAPAAGGKE